MNTQATMPVEENGISVDISMLNGLPDPVFFVGLNHVIVDCNRAANEECPTWPGQPVSGHWGMPDPVKDGGTDTQKRLAFHQTYGALQSRIMAFSALSFENLDRGSLQKSVDKIGNETAKKE